MKYISINLLYQHYKSKSRKTIKMTTTYITIKGLSAHYTYGVDRTEEKCLGVLWDSENGKVDKLMEKEHHPQFKDKLNMMWVEKLKEVSGWVAGETLYAFLKSNADGYFNIWYSKKKEEVGFITLIVEPSGYVCRSYYNLYHDYTNKEDDIRMRVMIRTESVYNDFVCDRKNR